MGWKSKHLSMTTLFSDDLLEKFPPLEDRSLLELLNSFEVVGDHVTVQRRRSGFLQRAFDEFTGVSHERQTTINTELLDGLQLLNRYVTYLDAGKIRTQIGLVRVAESCHHLQKCIKSIAAGNDKIKDRLGSLESGLLNQVQRHDAHLDCENVTANLASGNYGRYPLLIQFAIAIEDLAWRGFFRQVDARLREFAVSRLTDAAASRSGLSRHTLISVPGQLREVLPLNQDVLDAFELLTRPLPPHCPFSEAIYLTSRGRFDLAEAVPGLHRAVSLTSLIDHLLIESQARMQQPATERVGHRLRQIESMGPARVSVEVIAEPKPAVRESSSPKPKIGVVMSGGGAKGAYLVGVLRAMAEAGLEADCVSGTSIGALNGSILASRRTVSSASECLAEIWDELARRSPLQLNHQGLSTHLGLAFAKLVLAAYGGPHAEAITFPLIQVLEREARANGIEASLLSKDPIAELLETYLDFSRKDDWLPFWVASFRASLPEALWEGIKGSALKMENRPAEFFKVQDLSVEEVGDAILASAALPVLFPQQSLGNGVFFDGGIGGGRKGQGNTPAQPLAESRCDLLIVTHLSNGALWDRRDFPDAGSVIDIRPSGDMGGFAAMLDFSPNQLQRLRRLGYEDAMRCFEAAYDAIELRNASLDAEYRMNKALEDLETS